MALRQQLCIYQRKSLRPKLQKKDRLFWILLSIVWGNWKSALTIVSPETVIKWHRQGFKLFWKWKSRKRGLGRPKIDKEIRSLIRNMSIENPLLGAPRIQAELKLLGYDVAESTVRKYRARNQTPPSQTWRTFLKNHMGQTAAIDFFTIPTLKFEILYCFLVLSHDKRKILHFNITGNPTAEWTIQQMREAFPFDKAPRYLLRDRDSIYSLEFRRVIKSMGIEEIVSAPRSPWQNSYVERMIGSIRRECLDHLIFLNRNHLIKILKSYFYYYHNVRPHQSLDRKAPAPREVETVSKGKIIALPQVGGLHHQYKRAA